MQYTEDQTIISRVAQLQHLIEQHAGNFYRRDAVDDRDISTDESIQLSNPGSRFAIIRQRIAMRIIRDIIQANVDRRVITIHEIIFLTRAN